MPTKKPATPPAAPTETEDLLAEVKAIQEEAKGTFSLAERLDGLHFKRGKIVLYLETEDIDLYAAMQQSLEVAAETIARVEAGSQQHQDLIAAYTEAEEEALKQEKKSLQHALSVHMQAIPDPAHEKARRAARKAVSAKGTVIPEESRETYLQVLTDQILGYTITQVVDANGNTGVFDSKTIGRKLRETLPIPQHARLVAKMNELVFNDALARQATSDPGF